MKQKQQELYKRVANSYDFLLKSIGYNNFLKYIINKNKFLKKKNFVEILDIGCGTGLSTILLKKRFKFARLTCLDYSEEMIMKCSSKIKNARYVIGDFNDRSSFIDAKTKKKDLLKNNSFDLVLSAGAISEYSNLKKSIPIVYSLLKKEKIFLNIGIKKNILNRFSGMIWRYSAVSPRDFKKECFLAGFSEVKQIKIPSRYFFFKYRYFVVIAKK
jgi:ubiquinone/menaquinone biosynthesis C-methylase UbiE